MDNCEYYDQYYNPPLSSNGTNDPIAPTLPPKDNSPGSWHAGSSGGGNTPPAIPPKTGSGGPGLYSRGEQNGNLKSNLTLNIIGFSPDFDNVWNRGCNGNSCNINETPQAYREYSKSPERKVSTTSNSSDIADKVNKFEAWASNSPTDNAKSDSSPKNLWFYKDGLRTPTTPPPTAVKLITNTPKTEYSPDNMAETYMASQRPLMNHVSTAQLTLSPRSARASGISAEQEPTKNISSLAVNLSNGSAFATSLTNGLDLSDLEHGQEEQMTRSLSNISSSSILNNYSFSSLDTPVCPRNTNSPRNGIPDHTTPDKFSRPPIPRKTLSSNFPPPVSDFQPKKLPPPPLPPKQSKENTPPPRPIGKELKLDDILSMCAEYERQIEAEQREAGNALSTEVTQTESHKAQLETEIKPSNSNCHTESKWSNSYSYNAALLENMNQLDNPLSPSLLSPGSPGSTLQPPRIKTNGSLPRDGKRMPSPSRSLPPNSPIVPPNPESESGIFNFDRKNSINDPGSPVLAGTFPRLLPGQNGPPRSPLANSSMHIVPSGPQPLSLVNNYTQSIEKNNSSPTITTTIPTQQNSSSSPRTRIRTTVLGRSSLCSQNSSSETLKDNCSANNSPAHTLNSPTSNFQESPAQFGHSDYQGGREGYADTDKSKEELYIEAREMLALISPGATESPSSTGPRKPPRSKHDSLNSDRSYNDVMPSSEAHNRLLIGTVMLSKNPLTNDKSQERNSKPEEFTHILKTQRDNVLHDVTKTAQELAELSTAIEEAERSIDLETSLIGAEMLGQQSEVESLSKNIKHMVAKESQMENNLQKWRVKNNVEINNARVRLEKAEAELDSLEDLQKHSKDLDTDAETELLELIKKSHEHLEAERRVFEDLEFRYMEEEAGMEAEIEDVSREIQGTKKLLDKAQLGINEMEHQKLEISVNQDLSIMQERRQTVESNLEIEKQKLSDLECKLRQMLTDSGSHRSSGEDSGTITWSDEEAVRIRSANQHPQWKLNRRGNSMEGSDPSSESTSDLPNDSTCDSRSPSPRINQNRTHRRSKTEPHPLPLSVSFRQTKRRVSSQQKTDDQEREKISDQLVGMNMSQSFDGSHRPLSTDTGSLTGGGNVTDASSWIGGVTMRRSTLGRGGQRPLTRYLPVTSQENFDLRSHIETAGHQIELCKHIVLNSCSCRGYLCKLGARFKSWNRRWFVFDRNKRTLVYYADKSENKAKGGIYFHSIAEVYVDHQTSKSASQRVTFCMKTSDRKYYLMAPSPEAMRIWVDVIFTGAEGYQEFQD